MRNKIKYILLIIIPLLLGFFIYITKSESTYISNFISIANIKYPLLINNYACDFLWAFSLCLCLKLTIGKNNKLVILASSLVSIVLEVLQIYKIVPGTFDIFDIVIELCAILLAFIIIKFYFEGELLKNEKGKCNKGC